MPRGTKHTAEKIISQLDVVLAQVLIETIIMDVSIDDKRYDCVIISIDDLYEKLIEFENNSNTYLIN